MARMYRAGTAFVQVVPSFEGIQKGIASKLRRDLREGLNDKHAFAELERNIQDAFSSALRKSREEVNKDIRGMVADVDKEVTKGATTSARNIKKVVNKELGGGWHGEQMRKIGRDLEKTLGTDTFHNLRKEHADMRKAIEKDINTLSTSFTKSGERDAREVDRAYNRLKKAMDKIRALEDSGLSQAKRSNVGRAADILGGDNYARMIEGKSEDQIREEKRLNRKAEAESERHAKKVASIQERANAELRRIDNEQRKHQAMNDARDAARARERYRSLYETQYRQSKELASIGAGGNRKQERLTFKKDASLDRYRAQIQGLVDDLSKLNNSQPHVRLNTKGAYNDLKLLQNYLDDYERRKPHAEVGITGDEQVKRELQALKMHAERILRDVDFEIDVDDDRAKFALEQFRAQAEAMRDINVGVDVDLNRAEYERVRAQLAALGKQTEDIKIRVDPEGVYDDVAAIDAALESIRDKRVGVDITEREALAQIATVSAAAEALDDQDVDITVDVDRDRLVDFSRNVDLAQTRMRRLNRRIKDSTVTMAESTQAFRIFNPVLAAVAFLGAPAVSTLGGVVAGLGGIASFAPGAAAGLSPLMFAFTGLEDAAKKYEKAQEALAVPKKDLTEAQKESIEKWEAEKDALGEATVAWIEYTDELKTQITEVQKGAREGLFPGLQSSIEMIMGRYAKPFTSFLKDTGEHLADISNMWAQGLTSDEAAEWFARVGRDTEEYTTAMGIWVQNTVEGLGHLVDAFRPFAKEFSDWLINSSQRWADWTDSLVGNDALLDFLESARNILPRVGDLLKNLGELFVNLTEAVEPFAVAIFDAMNDALEFINAMDPAVLGAILGAVGGLTGGLMLLSGVMAGIGALSGVLSAIGSSLFTQVAFGLGSFIAVSATALGATTALGSETGVLGDAFLTLGSSMQGAADFTKAVWELMGHLLDAVSPLAPVLADLVGDFMELTYALGGGLISALGWVVDLVGLLIDGFTSLPEWVQETALVVGIGAMSFGKLKGGIELVIPLLTSAWETFKLWGMYGKDALKSVGEAFTPLASGLKAAETPLEGLNVGLVETKKGLKSAGKAAGGFFGALTPASWAALGIVAVAGAITAMSAASDAVNLEPAVKETEDFDAAIQGMTKSAQAAKTNLNLLFEPEGGEGTLGSWADFGVDEINGVADAMELMADRTSGAKGSLNELDSEFYTLFGAFGDTAWDTVRKQLEGMDDSLAGLVSTDFESAAQGYLEVASAAADAGVGQEELNSYFGDYKKKLENTAASLGGIKLTQEEYTRWMAGEVPPAIQAAADAEENHGLKLDGVTSSTEAAAEASERLVDATNAMQDAFDRSQDAADKVAEAQEVIKEAVKTGETAIHGNTEEAKRNRRALRNIRDGQQELVEQNAILEGSTDGMSDAMWENYNAMYENLVQMTGNKKEARKYANELYGIPDDVDTKAEFIDKYANPRIDVTQKKIDDLDDSEADPDVDAKTGKANEKIDETVGKLDNLDNKDVTVWVKIKNWWDDLWNDDGKPKKSRSKRGATNPDRFHNYHGNILEHYAQGGLKPMEPIAQMVKPNTWRVVGDRMKDDEAYIPLDGSPRSKAILMEAIVRMPNLMHDGGILNFAAGGVAAAAGDAEAKVDPATGEVDSSAITEAFASLTALLGESWNGLLTDMLGKTEAFFGQLLAITVAQNAGLLAAHQASNAAILAAHQANNALLLSSYRSHFSTLSAALAAHNSAESSSVAGHLSALSGRYSSWRSSQQGATSSFLSTILSLFQSGDASLRRHWGDHLSAMSSSSTDFRSRESNRFNSFLNSTMIGHIDTFGRTAENKWENIWNSLVSSATKIFGQLPPAVGNILSSTAGKMNTHIVTPYNKVVSDLDLSKKLKISPFPTQSYADGGMMRGYTPGRDVHKFYSPTGGLLELSGGEPVLRPELGAVLGPQWVDAANAAARNGGIAGAKKFLSGGQAFADGGIFDGLQAQSFAKGGTIKKDHAGLIQLGRLLQSLGVRVSEHSAFGGNSGGHAPNSWHNRDGAIDLNTAPGQSAKEMADFDKMMPLLYKLGWGVIWRYPNHYNHAHLDLGNRSLGNFNRNPNTSGDLWEKLLKMKVGPATGAGGSMDIPYDIQGDMKGFLAKAAQAVGSGALPELMMGVGNKVFTALAEEKADQFVESVAFGGGTDYSDVANGPIKKMAKAMLEKKGWGNQFRDLDWLLTRESSWNPRAQNPSSTAYGLFQFLNSTWATVGGRKTSDPKLQLDYGLRYIQQRYGDVRGARAFWNKHHWYADGGITDFEPDLSPEVLFRDGGGPLPTGYSIVQNNLGHEETILPKTVADVSRTFERLEQVTNEGGVTITDSNFGPTAAEVGREVHREARIQRIGRAVKF